MQKENKKILFLSNGYGEDTISCSIIEKLLSINKNIDILVLPIVGEGKIYRKMNYSIIQSLLNNIGLFRWRPIKNKRSWNIYWRRSPRGGCPAATKRRPRSL